uniref:D-xylose 1-dehydrogenase (NADP(+), D-xylono-1,5-lactone-forming) n=1 Tax=Noctiluca scintillans TaxID=2966 RepID=A0A7S1F7R0_NOCSC|mmetsp:Transcript_39683/g.105088  ORF Transcript_39683/g.105088 Transcript_39683/m.105088 type:complete len:385 (+) Transcript_39683:62-1216(+)
MVVKSIRWGILGTGKICQDFASAVGATDGAELYGVAARDFTKAQDFAKNFNVTHAYESYEALAESDVDVVYVGTWHTLHEAHVMLCFSKGKNVVVEKPMAVNAAQARRMVAAARRRGLFLMEAHWTRFMPAVKEAVRAVEANEIGEIVAVLSDFGYLFGGEKAHMNQFRPEMAGGALLEIGCYPISAAFHFLSSVSGLGPPVTVVASGTTELGVDVSAGVVLKFPRGRVATLGYSYLGELPEQTTIIGSRGRIVLHNPGHCPTKVSIVTLAGQRNEYQTETKEYPLPKLEGTLNCPNSEGLVYECAAVGNLLRAGKKESDVVPLDESVHMAEVMDSVRHQVGVVYPADGLLSRMSAGRPWLQPTALGIFLLLTGAAAGAVLKRR